jgi:hypothetical protein
MDLPPKQDVARALLLSGSVFIHLDPRREGVAVPKWLRRQPQLVLQVGLDMAIPIPDLRVDERGIYGTLSFNRSPFTCLLPWEAIFALAGDDGRGMVWPESMPAEISAEIEREAGRRAPAGLSVVEVGEGSAEDDLEVETDPAVIPLRPARKPSAPAVARDADPDDAAPDAPAPSEAPRPNAKGKVLPPYLRIIK